VTIIHLKIIRENKFFQCCNTIEDEKHFVLLCANYANLRNNFIPLNKNNKNKYFMPQIHIVYMHDPKSKHGFLKSY
jgi:hypothetical protein